MSQKTTLQKNLARAQKKKGLDHQLLSDKTGIPLEQVILLTEGHYYHRNELPIEVYEKICKELDLDPFETVMDSFSTKKSAA